MAPTSANVGSCSSLSSIHARSKKCYSWDCLSPSEQAGIIVSVVVTSMVLLFVYMYYLGRVTIAHQEVVMRRQRRQRRRRTNQTQVHPVALVQLPIAPQYPSQDIVYTYTPFIYQPADQVNNFQSQTTRILIPQHPIPAVAPLHPTTYAGYPVAHVQGQNDYHQTGHRPVSVLISAPSERSSRCHTEWLRRLRRVFGLPWGRASTIASDCIPSTPIIPPSGRDGSRRGPRLGRPGPERTRLGRSHYSGSERTLDAGYLGPGARHQDDERRETTGIQSPPSAVATVHSDDYDSV
ncbi:l-aminoadipate-semialdehyde dehydrogenase large subunit [Fusarium langsethiae]|uniref:L-aminoadipate-semialdehyde dehydrogenase large subunit n=1 Tax=Fusarium langsethiae TaxID=179993 RepID=A0A0M9F672_FUSLA|nr:l-aminoadipate-semialdehyde dehydrogenase large subunit [Fusarium langsethiae]GKT97951.1 unnamed protein product [Fusarium langsethiae]GKU13369.1 unnamed protein product [Fusarium langsethiae]